MAGKSWAEMANEMSEFTYFNNGDISVHNAVLLGGSFRNFAGEKDRWGSSERKFSIAVPVNEIDRLRDMGFYIRTLTPRDEDDDVTYHLQIKVNSLPEITLVTEWEGKETGHKLDIEEYYRLDNMRFSCVDICFHAFVRNDKEPPYTAWLSGKYNTFFQEKEFNPFPNHSFAMADEEMPFTD